MFYIYAPRMASCVILSAYMMMDTITVRGTMPSAMSSCKYKKMIWERKNK